MISAGPSEVFVVVRIGDALRLVELGSVDEIVPAMLLAHPTGVEGACRGVATVRGQTLPVFDLARRTGPLDTSQLIVIAHVEEQSQLGILVDDVLDIVELAAGLVLTHSTGVGSAIRTTSLAGQVVTVLTPREVLCA